MIWKSTISWATLTDSKSGVTQQGPYEQPWCQSSRSLTPNQDAVFRLAPPREPGAETKKNGCWCLSHAWCCPVTLVVDDTIRQPGLCRAAGEAPWKQAFWSRAEEMKTARSMRRFCQLARYWRWCQGDMTQNGTCSWAYSLPFYSDLSVLQGDCFLLLCLILSKWQSSFRKKVGLRGGACTLPLYPHLISPLSLLVFSPPFLRQSVPPSTSACQQAHHTHTCARTHARAHTHTRVSTHSLEPSLLSVANTRAHRHKHTLRQSKSKNKRGEGEQRETEGEKESRSGRREGLDVDTMRKHKGFHIFPDWPASHLECDLSLV